MSNKRRVMVTIHYRDELSLRDNRARLGLSAYHWGILIQPKNPKGLDSNAYDVSDGARPDPMARQDLNPSRDWHFRAKLGVSPILSGRLLGKVMVGKVPNNVTDANMEDLLRKVPLPIKNTGQNCVTWTLATIQALQKGKLAEDFDVNEFMTKALGLADEWLQHPGPNNFHNYVDRVD